MSQKSNLDSTDNMVRSQLINDINLVSMILGAEMFAGLVIKKGFMIPVIKVKRAKRVSKDTIKEAKEAYLLKRSEFRKFLHLPVVENEELGDKHIQIWHRILSRLFPSFVIWDVYRKLEIEHQMGFMPVVLYRQDMIGATVEMMKKPTNHKKEKQTKTAVDS